MCPSRTKAGALLQGMQNLVKERPEDPIGYLAAFLLKNKDAMQKKQEEKAAKAQQKAASAAATATPQPPAPSSGLSEQNAFHN